MKATAAWVAGHFDGKLGCDTQVICADRIDTSKRSSSLSVCSHLAVCRLVVDELLLLPLMPLELKWAQLGLFVQIRSGQRTE